MLGNVKILVFLKKDKWERFKLILQKENQKYKNLEKLKLQIMEKLSFQKFKIKVV